MIMETRKCTECGQTKPISEMSKSYPNRCKACVAEHTRMVRQRAKNNEAEPTSKIDWEQRRYEIAKSIYPTVIKALPPKDAERAGRTTIMFTDLLIKELKGENEQPKEVSKEPKQEAVDVKIGSVIQIEGVDYICLNAGDNDCCSCDFLIDGDCASLSWLKCHSECRKDRKDVMFIKKGGNDEE